MLVVNTKEIFLQNLHQNGVHFPAERNSFVFDHQHACRDLTCKPAIFPCKSFQFRHTDCLGALCYYLSTSSLGYTSLSQESSRKGVKTLMLKNFSPYAGIIYLHYAAIIYLLPFSTPGPVCCLSPLTLTWGLKLTKVPVSLLSKHFNC